MLPVELIKKKRSGQALTHQELKEFINQYLADTIPDYQMSALLMSIFFQGMTEQETLALTEVMLNSGEVLSFSELGKFCVDKHSTGGVGDKTSLILAPIVASLGIPVPMISGRGLGHTGGTLDKLESIPGFNTQLSLPQFKQLVAEVHVGLIGQTPTICPADKRIYSLRDVTATVESLPLICASIMSKKLAEGIDGLVLDVKFGSGAFMKTFDQAKLLAQGLMAIAQGSQKKVVALLTDMEQPLGRFAGNILEVQECWEILENQRHPMTEDTRALSLELAAWMVHLATKQTLDQCRIQCELQIQNGQALAKFKQIIVAQGGQLQAWPKPQFKIDVLAPSTGYVARYQVEKLGWINVALGAGRKTVQDPIEPTAGLEFYKRLGQKVEQGEPIFSIYGPNQRRIKEVEPELLKCVEITQDLSQISLPLMSNASHRVLEVLT